MPSEMRLAALLAKGASGRADVFGAHQVLQAATLAGAKACGLDDRIGSIVVGKQADLAAFDLGALDYQPIFDVASHLIFVVGREAVSRRLGGREACCAEATIRRRTAPAPQREGVQAT